MRRLRFPARLLIPILMISGGAASAQDDAADLAAMLQHFLANADKREVHDSFWADELVYSSSSGLRFGKADIMQGFDNAPEDGDASPDIVYSGEDIDVRVYDDAAVVAFKLVGTPGDGSQTLYYYNTGTFLKRDGRWRVVAWQATKIPPANAN